VPAQEKIIAALAAADLVAHTFFTSEQLSSRAKKNPRIAAGAFLKLKY